MTKCTEITWPCAFIIIMRLSIPVCLYMPPLPFLTQDNDLITVACSKHWSEDIVWNMLGTCVFTTSWSASLASQHGLWLHLVDHMHTHLSAVRYPSTLPPTCCCILYDQAICLNQKNKFSYYANSASKYTSVFLQKASWLFHGYVMYHALNSRFFSIFKIKFYQY